MKRYLLVAAAAMALAACHKTAETAAAPSDATAASSAVTDSASSAASDAASSAAAATVPAAPDFVAMAAASDMYEIQAAKIAQKRSKTPDVKDFAKMMVTDHTKSTAMIKKAVADAGRTDIMPPTALPDDKKAMIDALNAASDADFDKTYVDQQVTAHKDALALMTSYATSGDVPQLKDAAGKIAPVVQMHLDKITSIQAGLSH
jgi:putative membrane protein